jgi:hypothetical protein
MQESNQQFCCYQLRVGPVRLKKYKMEKRQNSILNEMQTNVCIEGLGIVLGWMSNTQNIDIGNEYQYFCLDVFNIWNPN